MIKNVKVYKPSISGIKYLFFKNKIDIERMNEETTDFSTFIDNKVEKYGHFSLFANDDQIELSTRLEMKYTDIEKSITKEYCDFNEDLIVCAYEYPQDLMGTYFSAKLEEEYQNMNDGKFHKIFKYGELDLPAVKKIKISNLDDSNQKIKYGIVPESTDIYQYGNSKYVRIKKDKEYNKEYAWYILSPIEWIVDKENNKAISKKRITSSNLDIRMKPKFYANLDKLLNEIKTYCVEICNEDNSIINKINAFLDERNENVEHLKESNNYFGFDTKMLCDAVLFDKLTEIKDSLKSKYDFRFKNQELAEALNLEHGNINHLSNLVVETLHKLEKIGNEPLLKYFKNFIETERKIAFENYQKSFDINNNDKGCNNYSFIIKKVSTLNKNLDRFKPLVDFLDIFDFKKTNNTYKKSEAHIKLKEIKNKVFLSINNHEIDEMYNEFVKSEVDNIISILVNYTGDNIDLKQMEKNLLLRISHLMDRIITAKELSHIDPTFALIKK